MKKQITTVLALLMLTSMFYYGCKKDEATTPTPQPVQPTTLQVNVLNETGNIMQGATVNLYKSLEDWQNNTNIIATKTTGTDGSALFTSIDAEATYYFLAQTQCEDNTTSNIYNKSKLAANQTNIINTVLSGKTNYLVINSYENETYELYIDGNLMGEIEALCSYQIEVDNGTHNIEFIELDYEIEPIIYTTTLEFGCGSTNELNFGN